MKKTPPRAWQRMLSGRRLNLLDPSPLDIELMDIAHGLARVPRWNGQTVGEHIFSVAQHSVLVHAVALALEPDMSKQDQCAVLLHDAPEYVIGDIISPFKAMIGDKYKKVESDLQAAIHLRFGLPPKCGKGLSAVIKQADRAAAYMEAIHLAGFQPSEADHIFEKPALRIQPFEALLNPWKTSEAQEKFLSSFASLEN